MPHPIEPSTLRILKPTGETVGTGFLVSKNLAVTCAHVVKILGAGAGDTIDIRFTGKSAATTACVLREYWTPDDSTDIAILQVDDVPTGVFPLRMGRASESRLKNDLYTFGYAIAGDEQGIGGLGTFITLKQEGNFIQFRMHEANHGHSGAPIYDDKRGVVVGMIKKGHRCSGRNAETTFAIPSETIWQVCPELKPVIPPLPRRNPIVEGINLLPYNYAQSIQNFLTEYLGTDSHPVPFGGRDHALKMLDAWLAETTPYLLLAAPAGRGKSALLVRWLDSLKTREDLALAFVPVSIRFGTNMGRVFYAVLSTRLAFLHGDDIPASPETSTAVYRRLVSDYLSKPLANGRTLLVVLDGLDEASTDRPIGADFMPGELPAGVRVVVSARFLAGDTDSTAWLRRLNWERTGLASAPSLTPLDQEGMRDVLFKMGCPLDELSRNVDIVAELYRLSEGDPLLVGLYVGDLWAKGEAVTRLQPEDLASIQPGYKGYFDRWWEDQKKLWGKDKPWLEKHVRAVRNLLAGALGPLFRDDFHALDPKLASDYIADALDVLQRFIIGDNQTQGYTFSHPKLGQYFWDSLTPIEQKDVEYRLLTWSQQVFQQLVNGKRDPKKKVEVPAYVVRNYSIYLAQTKQPIENWLPLIHHQQWAQAWFTLEGAYGGYLQDAQRVWEQCKLLDQQSIEIIGQAFYLGMQIRCTLIEASLHSFAGNIPPKLIWPLIQNSTWTWQQAWIFVRQMPESQQLEAIIEIIPHIGDRQLPEILKIARAIDNKRMRFRILSQMAKHLPEKYLRQMLVDVRATDDKVEHAKLLSILAQRLPEIFEEALEAARGIKDVSEFANVLSILAQCRSEISGEVLETAWMIFSKIKRAEMMSIFAQSLPDISGEIMEILEKEWLGTNTSDPATLHQSMGYLEKLGESLRAKHSYATRAYVLNSLAQHLPERYLGQLLYVTRAIDDEVGRARILSSLAQRLPEISREALEAVRVINNDVERARLLGSLVQCLPEISGEALEAAWWIDDEVQRIDALCTLAQHLPEISGNVLNAVQMIRDNDIEIIHLLEKLVPHLPQKYLGQMLVTAQNIQDEGKRYWILSILAEHWAEGSLEQMLPAVQSINNERLRSRLLRQIEQQWTEGNPMQVITARDARIETWEIKNDYGTIETLLHQLAEGTRVVLFHQLTSIIPVVIRLGTKDTPREIYEAAHDVTTWWP